jgi:hypothetical protein
MSTTSVAPRSVAAALEETSHEKGLTNSLRVPLLKGLS